MVTALPWPTWAQLMDKLQRLCAAQCSGTLFCVTETNDSAFIVIRQGDIVALGFKTVRGAAAIPALKGVKHCRYKFKNKAVLWVDANLPDTADILQQFGGNPTPPARPAAPSPASASLSIEFAALRKIMQEEANRAFGPVGALLCAEQFAQAGVPQSVHDLDQLLTAIVATVGVSERATAFQDNVRARLRTVGV